MEAAEHSDILETSTKQPVLEKTKDFVRQTTTETKRHVDEALAKVPAKTWTEPLGKACAVTGGLSGNSVPGNFGGIKASHPWKHCWNVLNTSLHV